MADRHVFEWYALVHPSMADWLDALRDVGWYRDSVVPGVKTPLGTIEYSFVYLGRVEELGA